MPQYNECIHKIEQYTLTEVDAEKGTIKTPAYTCAIAFKRKFQIKKRWLVSLKRSQWSLISPEEVDKEKQMRL